jgi:hypothetical protein
MFCDKDRFSMLNGSMQGPFGCSVPVDLQRLITEVLVSPLAPSWFEEALRSVIGKYLYTFSVVTSLRSQKPIY